MAAKVVLIWKSAGVSPWAQYRQLPKITRIWENYVIDDAASMRTLTSGHFHFENINELDSGSFDRSSSPLWWSRCQAECV